MSNPQIPSNPPDAPQSPSTGGGATESLAGRSEGQLPKPFNSSRQPRRNYTLLARAFLVTFFALALLLTCLWAFSKRKPLSKWEQRSFNALSILLTAIASLGLGSLFGHLGSMLRWPLLARTAYQMQDVDSILGMSPPTGSLRLIKRHIREQRISPTTFIVIAYLIINVVGRLSVAIFGLAFNMKDTAGIEYPIVATNWTSALWTGQIFPGGTAGAQRDEYESGEAFMNSVWNGLQKYAKLPDWAYGQNVSFDIGDDISPYLPVDLRVPNTTLKINGNTIEYSYQLKDFKEGYSRPSNHTVHSSANCSLIEVGKGQYWRWGNGNRTGPLNWGKKDSVRDNVKVVPEILRVSNDTDDNPYWVTHWMSFLDPRSGSSAYPQIYILCENIAWECWPTLTETDSHNESRQIQPHERFFHPTDLYRLLTVGNGDYGDTSDGRRVYLNGFSGSFSASKADDDGACTLCDNGLFKSPNETVWNGYRLWMAGLLARFPILAIMHANTDLPQFAHGPHPNQTAGTAYLHTTLEVNWLRVALIAAGITGGQILAILAVLGYCSGVYTRDDSHLATAELLKTVINKFDDGKLMTGEELAASLDGALGERVRYGTKQGKDGCPPEVDLASNLESNFLPFPGKQ